jgi:hypothetical protein
MDAESIDAVVTDPPYGLEFMGKEWDKLGAITEAQKKDTKAWWNGSGNLVEGASGPFGGGGQRIRYGSSAKSMQEWHESWAREVLRVLKPGAHLLAFGGTRTYHRMTCALEDAGFEIRDCLMWLYGSGFPKSLDVSKAIDKAAGAKREVLGRRAKTNNTVSSRQHLGTDADGRCVDGRNAELARQYQSKNGFDITAPFTPSAQQWQGWGTALKPAYEPIVLARKPLIGTVAQNVQKHGTGAINIDGCRIETIEVGGARERDPERMKQPDWRMTGGSTGS